MLLPDVLRRLALPDNPTTGSLCSGYGGIEMATHLVFGSGRPAWVADNETDVILAERFPGVPNLGDITRVDWMAVPRVHILTAGFPCQDISSAGAGAGLNGERSGVWANVAIAVRVLRPELVVLENVRGLCSAKADSGLEYCPGCMGDDPGRIMRALGAVLGDLARLGYDAEWCCVRASDIGAPHQRERVVVLAWPAG